MSHINGNEMKMRGKLYTGTTSNYIMGQYGLQTQEVKTKKKNPKTQNKTKNSTTKQKKKAVKET